MTLTTPAHGTLVAKYVDDDATRQAIEERIPDGYTVEVNATSSAAYWLCYLHGPNGGRLAGPLRVSRGVPITTACLYALTRWDELWR